MGGNVKDFIDKLELEEEITSEDIRNLLNDADVFESYKIMKDLLKVLKKKRDYLINQKHLYEKNNNICGRELVKFSIKRIKQVEKMLREEIDNLVFPQKEEKPGKENIPVFLKMQISSLSDIKSMQYLLDDETINLLSKIEEDISINEKSELIELLIIKFESMLKQLENKLDITLKKLIEEVKSNTDYVIPFKKKKIKNFLNDDKYKTFKLNIDYYEISINGIKNILERLYTLKGIQKAALAKENRELERRNADIFDDNIENTIKIILNNSNLEEDIKIKTNKVVHHFYRCLNSKSDNLDINSLKDYTNFFCFIFQMLRKEEIICLSNVFRRSLQKKNSELKNSKNDNSIIRKQIKQFIKRFEKEKDVVFYQFKENDVQIYTSIFKPLLEDELNYYYFSRILEEVKNELNVYEIKNIFEEIVDKYIVNYKYKLANQGFAYTDPKYYESLLILLMNKGLLNKENKEFLSGRLEDFRNYLCGKGGNISQPKSEALKDIDNLCLKLSKNICIETVSSNLKNQIERLMAQKIPYIVQNASRLGFSSGDEEMYKDYSYSTFVVGNYAYSKRYNDEGDLLFQIHVLDTSSIITENETIDDEIKKSHNIPCNFKYEVGQKYPVMTFQFRIYQNNTVGKMKLFSNIIKVDSIYTSSDLENYRDNDDLKNLMSAYKRIGNFCLDDFDIDKNTDCVLSTNILDFLNGFDKEVPMMYRRSCDVIQDNLIAYNHNQLCYYLSKVPKKQAHKIFYILDEELPEIYTNYQTDDAYIYLDSFSYSGIYLIRTIKKLINKDYQFNDEDYEKEKASVIKYCKTLNEQFGYVPDKIMKQDKIKNIDKR